MSRLLIDRLAARLRAPLAGMRGGPSACAARSARRRIALLALSSALAPGGCGQVEIAVGEPTTEVFKYRGSIQCGDRGVDPDAMASQLRAAGVAVLSIACGQDPLARPAVCGAQTGEINIFEIFRRDLDRARALSFTSIGIFSPPAYGGPATRVPCPAP